MTYIENVFVCMAAPLVVALLSLKRGHRAALVFCLAGMGACLLSAYLNTFFARLYQADAVNAATQIAPVVEEIMKLLPLLFFLAVFEPTFARFRLAAVSSWPPALPPLRISVSSRKTARTRSSFC